MLLSSSERFNVVSSLSFSSVIAAIFPSSSLDTSAVILPQTMEMANIPIPVQNALARVQTVGEMTFLAAVLVAFLQLTVALFQYRTNPIGELIVPKVK
jgi:hypothetical protein